MTYEIDVTPASNPLGPILTTLGDDDLLPGTRFRPVKLGTGLVKVVIHADNPKAAALEDEVFLRYRDTVIGGYIYSGSLSSAQIKLVSEKKDHRVLGWSGLGSLGPLARMTLGEDIYALGPPVQTARGSFDVPGMYTWTNVTYGAVGRRIFEEGRDHPHNPYVGITATFDRDAQTGGAPWTLAPEKHQERVGTNALDAYVNLIKAGVIYELTPGLVLNSWETFGSDHSGPAFALDVVRFMVGANALDMDANTMTEIERAWQSMRLSELIVIGADNVTVKVTDPTAPFGKVGVYHYEVTSDPTVLTAVGNAELARRLLRTIGALKLPVILEDDPLNGKYLPGPGRPLWVANTVSGFTGTAAYDFDAEFPVAALDFVLTESKGWTCEAELGTPFIDRAQAAQDFAIRQIIKSATPAPHSHPEMLCPPTVACADLTADMLTAAAAANGDAENTGGGQWSGGAYQTAQHFAGARSYGALSGTSFDFTYTFDPAQVFLAGVRHVIDVWGLLESGGTPTVSKTFGVPGVDQEVSIDPAPVDAATGNDGELWARHRVCWTPTEDRTGVVFRWQETAPTSGHMLLDSLALYTAISDELAGASPHASRCDHGHRAQDIVYSDTGTPLGATNVQAAIEALKALIGSGSFVEKINGGNETVNVVADCGSAYTIDLATGNHQDLTLTQACTLTMPAPGAGKSFTAFVRQDAVGGRIPTFSGAVWPAGITPSWSTGANNVDIVGFVSDGVAWYGVVNNAASGLVVRSVGGADIDPVAELEFDDDFTVTDEGGGVARVALAAGAGTAYEPLTNGDTASPELIYTDGDVVMVPM